MLAELGERFETIKRDSNIRAVILTGAGEKAFSAGTDIKELASFESDGVTGAIAGRALYEGTLDFKAALKAAKGK